MKSVEFGTGMNRGMSPGIGTYPSSARPSSPRRRATLRATPRLTRRVNDLPGPDDMESGVSSGKISSENRWANKAR